MRLTKQDQVLVAVNDGGDRISTREIAKHLKENPSNVSQSIFQLKKKLLIEHKGYQRYGLTDRGRMEVSEILKKMNPDVAMTHVVFDRPAEEQKPQRPAPEEPLSVQKKGQAAQDIFDALKKQIRELEDENSSLYVELREWQKEYRLLALTVAHANKE